MLVMKRIPGQSVLIGDDVKVTIISARGGQVRFAIKAPSDTVVLRDELAGGKMGSDPDTRR
ncbi:MAG: carbon storage regulator [Sedimenticolaceae bacterium]